MKSLDRAIIVSDTLKTETSPVPVPFPFPAPLPVPDSGFSIRPEIGHGFFLFFLLEIAKKGTRPISSYHEWKNDQAWS